MSLSQQSRQHLNETRKWTFFLAIIGFVFIGLIIILGFSMGTIMQELGDDAIPFPGFFMGFIYLVMAALYFFPIYYLFKFSTNMKNALLHNIDENLDDAFKNLKSHYKFMGIFTIVIFSIYLIMGLGFALVGYSFL
jgi:membrane-anchored glycerophosphoryl diester phosphodiesterase (GDPDase)